MTVMGAGVGMVMMPANTTATRTLAPGDVPAGSTALAIVSQVGASAGTALMSVVLASHLAGTADAGRSASAYRHTYWWAVTLLILSVVPALLLPGRDRGAPAPAASPAGDRTSVRR